MRRAGADPVRTREESPCPEVPLLVEPETHEVATASGASA